MSHILGLPERTMMVSEPVTLERRDGDPFRLDPEVQRWCEDTLGERWRLREIECDFHITDPIIPSRLPITGRTVFAFMEFDTNADEVAFRLRWTGE